MSRSKAIKAHQEVPVHEEQKHYLACDLGNAYSNIRSDNNIAMDYRSILAPLPNANQLNDLPIDDVMKYEDEWWIVGERCYTLAPGDYRDSLNLNRYTSKNYKRLFAFALHKAFRRYVGREIIYPQVISSIPANLFRMPGMAQKVKEHLMDDYEIGNVHGGTLYVSVPNVTVIPEGIGTYFGYIFGPGNNSQFSEGTWMYADFGYLTLDSVFVRDGDYMPDMAKSDTSCGMSKVADQIQQVLFPETEQELSQQQIDEALECDILEANTRPVNVSKPREAVLAQIGQHASSILESWARNVNLRGLILTGGGAPYVHRHISSKMLPPLTLTRDPRRANVDGSYLYITAG